MDDGKIQVHPSTQFRHPKAHDRQLGQFALLHTAGMFIIAMWMGVLLRIGLVDREERHQRKKIWRTMIERDG